MTSKALSDEDLERYLVLRRKGIGHFKASRNVGLDPEVVLKRMSLDEEFADRVENAELESIEKYEDLYKEVAEAGDPKALANVLEKRDPKRWGSKSKLEVEQKTTIELEGDVWGAIGSLMSTLQARAALRGGGTVLELEGAEVEHEDD